MISYGNHRFPGKLFVVEGTDGSGKSTQLALLYQWLKAEGVSGPFFRMEFITEISVPTSVIVLRHAAGILHRLHARWLHCAREVSPLKPQSDAHKPDQHRHFNEWANHRRESYA